MGTKEEQSDVLTMVAEEIKNADEKVVYATDIAAKITSKLTEAYKTDRSSLIYYIQLGEILLEAKVKLGISFKTLITDKNLINPKQVQRLIKLVLTRESIVDYADCKTPAQFAALKVDERITKLTDKGIEKLSDPTQAKIIRMKNLKTIDESGDSLGLFEKVINGDDKIYNETKNFIKDKGTKTLKEPNKDKKPASMKDVRFKELYNKDMYSVIQMLHDAEKKAEAAAAEEVAALSTAKDHRMKLDVEKKKTKNEKQRREKAEEELNRITGAANRAKSPIDQESRV